MRCIVVLAAIAIGGAQAVAQDTVTTAMLSEGKAIFEGKRGALCVTCHGKNGKGMTGLGPDLTDDKWLHADGSLKAVADVISAGVLKPKESASVMPPMGGAKLNDAQVRAVAAYVLSLKSKSP